MADCRLGAARTGSVFALAPFIGAAIAWGLGDRHAGWFAPVAASLFALGGYLHLGERHAHPHAHEPLEHDHLHRHDHERHLNTHDPPVVGAQAHRHHQQLVVH